MYHTSPPHGQAHLRDRQNIDDDRRNTPRALNCLVFPVDLRTGHRPPHRRRAAPLDIGALSRAAKTFSNPATARPALLASDSKPVRRFTIRASTRSARSDGCLGLSLEALGKNIGRDRSLDKAAVAADPNAAAGKPPVKIGNDGSVRRQHEPDQLLRISALPRYGAEPLGTGAELRPVDQELMLPLCLHARLLPFRSFTSALNAGFVRPQQLQFPHRQPAFRDPQPLSSRPEHAPP